MHLKSNLGKDRKNNKNYVQFSKITGSVFESTFNESLENRSEDGVTNLVQTFCDLKDIGVLVMES